MTSKYMHRAKSVLDSRKLQWLSNSLINYIAICLPSILSLFVSDCVYSHSIVLLLFTCGSFLGLHSFYVLDTKYPATLHTGRQHGRCVIPQTVTHSLVLLKMGKIISRNMLSWLELLISCYCCIWFVVYIIYINDARSRKYQTMKYNCWLNI